jgi:hypothetical protein
MGGVVKYLVAWFFGLFRPCPGLAHPQMDLGQLLVAVTKRNAYAVWWPKMVIPHATVVRRLCYQLDEGGTRAGGMI